MELERLIKMFEEILDIRDSSGKRQCLTHIIVMLVSGILNKCIDFEDIYDYAKGKERWFNKKLGLWNGIQSSATVKNVFRLINPEQFLTI